MGVYLALNDKMDEDCVQEGGPLHEHLRTLGLGDDISIIPRPVYTNEQFVCDEETWEDRLLSYFSNFAISITNPMFDFYKSVGVKLVKEKLATSKLLREGDLKWLLQLRRHVAEKTVQRKPKAHFAWSDYWQAPPGCSMGFPLGICVAVTSITSKTLRHAVYHKLSSILGKFVESLEENYHLEKCAYALIHGHDQLHKSHSSDTHTTGICTMCGNHGRVLPELKTALAFNVDSIFKLLTDALDELHQMRPPEFREPVNFTTPLSIIDVDAVRMDDGLTKVKRNMSAVSELQARFLYCLTGSLLLGKCGKRIHLAVNMIASKIDALIAAKEALEKYLSTAKLTSLHFYSLNQNHTTTLPILTPTFTSLASAALHAQRLLTIIVHSKELTLALTDPSSDHLKSSFKEMKKELIETSKSLESAEKRWYQMSPIPENAIENGNPTTSTEVVVQQSTEEDVNAQVVFEAIGEQIEHRVFGIGGDLDYETPVLGAAVMKELAEKLEARKHELAAGDSPYTVSLHIQSILDECSQPSTAQLGDQPPTLNQSSEIQPSTSRFVRTPHPRTNPQSSTSQSGDVMTSTFKLADQPPTLNQPSTSRCGLTPYPHTSPQPSTSQSDYKQLQCASANSSSSTAETTNGSFVTAESTLQPSDISMYENMFSAANMATLAANIGKQLQKEEDECFE